MLAKTNQQIYDENIDRVIKMGTYKAGAAILGNKNKHQETRQSSNTLMTN